MTIDIYLIRHGEAAAAWGEDPDPGLSPLGRQQAQAVRDELEMSRELVLISSPLLRAQETAQPLAAALRSSVRIDPRFRELPSPVGMENRQAWLQKFMKQEWREQSDEILAWRETAWNHLFEVEKPTAIFSHFVMINAICSLLTDQPETVCCVPDNGSIMHVRQEGSALKLVSVGRQMPTKVN